MKLINDKERQGIGIFDNVDINFTGIMEAIAELNRKKNDPWSLEKLGKSKSIRYYGSSEEMRLDFKSLATQLKWPVSRVFVEAQNHSCPQVLVIGKGAE